MCLCSSVPKLSIIQAHMLTRKGIDRNTEKSESSGGVGREKKQRATKQNASRRVWERKRDK